jgi:hypothetical protein
MAKVDPTRRPTNPMQAQHANQVNETAKSKTVAACWHHQCNHR